MSRCLPQFRFPLLLSLLLLLLLSSLDSTVQGFGLLESGLLSDPIHLHPLSTTHLFDNLVSSSHLLSSSITTTATSDISATSATSASASATFVHGLDSLATSYQESLRTNPLSTQMATGVVLAVAGDALAQQRQNSGEYDLKRAASFAAFDAVYRAAQHYLYPPMIAACQGRVLGALLFHDHFDNNHMQHTAAALEQALASQLVLIPLLYYPVFFALTGFVQGLTAAQTVERATSSFGRLMTRNWAFWIPVQFAVFSLVPDEATQIPILIACGLVWTVILSALAGNAVSETTPAVPAKEEMNYRPEQEMERVAASLRRTTTPSLLSNARQPEPYLAATMADSRNRTNSDQIM